MTTLAEEEPYAAVVHDKYLPKTCSKCFAWNPLEGPERVNLSCCGRCYFVYYCSKKCQKGDWEDHQVECEFLRSFRECALRAAECGCNCPFCDESRDDIDLRDTRLLFKMLFKSKSQPDFKAFNGRTYESLKLDSDNRKCPRYMEEMKKVYGDIQRYLSPTPSLEAVCHAVSKISANSRTIVVGSPRRQKRGTGVYIGLSVHEHSCRPDAFTISDGPKIVMRTTKEGCVYSEKLSMSLVDDMFFEDTLMRRNYLSKVFAISCKCEECEDHEADKKRGSGRPSCCPEGWFSTSDLLCSICNKEVSTELAVQAKTSNRHLGKAARMFLKHQSDPRTRQGLVYDWIELFNIHKEILSDENTYLLKIAEMIYSTTFRLNLEMSVKYLDLCIPQTRRNPFVLNRVKVFCTRYMFYELAEKPEFEKKQALEEALETVEVVYGKKHELTLSLLAKKVEYDGTLSKIQ